MKYPVLVYDSRSPEVQAAFRWQARIGVGPKKGEATEADYTRIHVAALRAINEAVRISNIENRVEGTRLREVRSNLIGSGSIEGLFAGRKKWRIIVWISAIQRQVGWPESAALRVAVTS